jgi:hypothetical protein
MSKPPVIVSTVLPFPIIVIIGNDRHVCFYAFKHQNCESAFSLMHECEDSEWAYHQAELTVPYFICGYSGESERRSQHAFAH